MPAKERANRLIALGQATDATPGQGNPQAILAALKYMNELCGVVTVAQEKAADAGLFELPQILIAPDAPPPKAGSVEALKLLSAAKGSQYDEAFPSSPPPAPQPPKPYKSEVSVTVSEPQAS